MLDNVTAIILAGGKGTRLWPLTAKRAKPAVPIAGKYRLIDVSISNTLHSDIRKIVILTQFASESLHRHINQTYFFPPFSKGYAQILAAQQTLEGADWYQGTADAVRQNLTYLNHKDIQYYLILSGDHLYRMDYRELLKTHFESGADITVSARPISRKMASQFGILEINAAGKITGFYEKPGDPRLLDHLVPNQKWMSAHGFTNKRGNLLASMGIYVFNRSALFSLLAQNAGSDFGKEIFPDAISKYLVMAHPFEGYWEDIGTIPAFYNAMMSLTGPNPPFDFFDEEWPIYTHSRSLPGSYIDSCQIEESLICEGAALLSAKIHKCIIGIRSRVKQGARLDRVVLMGADYWEQAEDHIVNLDRHRPDVGIGEGTVIEKAIIDKNARIGKNVHMLEAGRPEEATEANYAIRKGILIIPKSAVIPPDFTL